MLKKAAIFVTVFIMMFSFCVSATPSDWALEEVTDAVIADLVPKRIQGDHQNPITREEFCEMVMLLYKKTDNSPILTDSTFTDTDNISVLEAYTLGIVNGVGDNLFSPNAFITRQEICTMLTRAYMKIKPDTVTPDKFPNTFPDINLISDWALNSVQYMNLRTIMLGDEFGNINPLGNTTREQAILLVYRLYKSISINAVDYLTSIMGGGGNLRCNLINGSIFSYTSNGVLYIKDTAGIREANTENYILNSNNIKNFVVYTNDVYFIDSEDHLYNFNINTNELKCLTKDAVSSFVSLGNKVYYKNINNGLIYVYNINNNVEEQFSDVPAEVPLTLNGTLYYSTGNEIISEKDNVKQVIYKGTNSSLDTKSGNLFFINENGYLSSISVDGSNYSVLYSEVCKQYCLSSDSVIVLDKNGYVNTLDYNGKYFIKIDSDSYECINILFSTVYAKKSDGTVFTFENDSTGKKQIY